MKEKLKKCILIILLTILISMSFVNFASLANETEIDKLETRQYSQKYKDWLNLSEEEKADTIAPQMYDIEETSSSKTSLLKAATSYDLRNSITLNVRNQQSTNTCWAFGVVDSLETNLKKVSNESYNFSIRHMDYSTSKTFSDKINSLGHNRELGDGGNAAIGFSYLVSGRGPVLESSMPFENNENKIKLSQIQNKEVVKKVSDYVYFPTIDKSDGVSQTELQTRNNIKDHISKYGSVTTSILAPGGTNDPYYNSSTYAYYCNSASIYANHLVNIVGWDDNYAVTNFNANCRPSKPGAYIVKNSWGTSWGKNGYYYISYEDFLVEEAVEGIQSIENIDYDNIYQYNPLGETMSIGFKGYSEGYGANVFYKDANKYEQLTEVSVSVLDYTKCDIYVNPNGSDLNINGEDIRFVKSISLSPGYHTIELDNPIILYGSKEFSVIIKYTGSNSSYPITIEEGSNSLFKTATSNKNESFVSTSGTANSWIDLKSTGFENANLCIKAFTSNLEDISGPAIKYYSHIQDVGWETEYSNKDGDITGLVDQGKKVEAFKFILENAPTNASVEYQSHVQDIGWESYVKNGAQSGTTGKNKKVEAIKIRLVNMPDYSVEYRGFINEKGWQAWVKDDQICGTTGQNRKLEAVQVRIVKKNTVGVKYYSHIQDVGWEIEYSRKSGDITGLENKGKKVEAFKFALENAPTNASIEYQSHVQDIGWESHVKNGAQSGTTGKNKKVEAIKIRLVNMPDYSVEYRGFINEKGWQAWVKDDQICGTTGQNRKLEAVQVRIVKKNTVGVKYYSHIQDVGWEIEYSRKNGDIAGLENKGKKVEAFKFIVENAPTNASIDYQSHVQDIGWESWVKNGAQSGTTGKNKKVEAIKIKLNNMKEYSVEYRGYVNGKGWQPWVRDGAVCGTTGQNRKLEAIQVRIVKRFSE